MTTRLRGHIYSADIGLEDRKLVLVISWNVVNEVVRQPVVALIASTDRERSLDTFVVLDAGEGGVAETSYVLCHFLLTVPESHIDAYPRGGPISASRLLEVEEKLATVLDLHTDTVQ